MACFSYRGIHWASATRGTSPDFLRVPFLGAGPGNNSDAFLAVRLDEPRGGSLTEQATRCLAGETPVAIYKLRARAASAASCAHPLLRF
jgi:hypothetical protein